MGIKDLSEPARLEQLAEEAAELAQAALKLARIQRKENPTPAQEPEARRALDEEFADVLLCGYYVGLRTIPQTDRVLNYVVSKERRWRERLERKEA